MTDMKLGLSLGYWGSNPPTQHIQMAQQAEQLGYDSVWTAEAYGSDALTPLAWIGAQTSRIRLGTGICQISARTPTAMAMAALTMDHLSNGRMILGLGVSGPQVVEGWYGAPFSKPLARTREYISIIRQVLAREEPVANNGEHYPLPYTGEGSWGLSKPLKPITHPLRADLPIMMGAGQKRCPGCRDRRRLATPVLLAVSPGRLFCFFVQCQSRLRGDSRRGGQHYR